MRHKGLVAGGSALILAGTLFAATGCASSPSADAAPGQWSAAQKAAATSYMANVVEAGKNAAGAACEATEASQGMSWSSFQSYEDLYNSGSMNGATQQQIQAVDQMVQYAVTCYETTSS